MRTHTTTKAALAAASSKAKESGKKSAKDSGTSKPNIGSAKPKTHG